MLSKVIFKGSVVCNSQGREEIIFLRLGPTGPRPNDICQGVLSMPGYHLKQKKRMTLVNTSERGRAKDTICKILT